MSKPARQVPRNLEPSAYAAPPMYVQPQPPLSFPQPPVFPQPYPPTEKFDPWHHTYAQILQDRNATVAKVTLVQRSAYDGPPDFEFKATGSSKREQGDKFNARTGELMSLSRAYLKLSRQLMSAARELVEPEPEDSAPEDNFVGVGYYAPEDEPELPNPALVAAVEAFNSAADALNQATLTLRALTD